MEVLTEALTREFEQAWMPTPPTLYRYVPEDRAAQVREGALWASNLNVHAREADMLEFHLGWGIIRTTALAMAEQAGADITLKTLCDRIASDKNPFSQGYSAYSLCLTTQPDADHMWTRFAKGGGVRFGFGPAELFQGIKNHQLSLFAPAEGGPAFVGHNPSLLAVHYEADELITAVEDMITKVVMPRVGARKAKAPLLDQATAASIPFYALRNVFIPMALSFKRAKFKPEREWRIILTGYASNAAPPAKGLLLRWADSQGKIQPLPLEDELNDPGRRP